ncbi:hypothetical protein DRW03_20955 [Corallococcus sp. H22C18031201]|uniref:GIN domain-containing protein n=1 Tax=Citreicoccus inhibens TaxID=2849499 RepID=UPI000E736BC2|nr:DUF2807 domain-containing protein [Citreicoccus inhibens]MBU8895806.1 DUF2807 domain-containing protein [Citreicoccus inhibens]RJS20219.1 hypothetical protein DRW03_20955 [Corallococcus sp. H22C18031201]
MWKLTGVGAVAAALLMGCHLHVDDEEDGFKVTESRSLEGFTRVENRTSMRVEVHEAARAEVRVTLERQLQDELETWVDGDTLIIDSGGPLSFRGDGVVSVGLPRFLGATLVSSGTLTVGDLTREEDVRLVARGSGDLRYCGPARSLTAELSSSGSVTLCAPEGAVTESVSLTASGSGNVRWSGLARSLEAETRGSGGITLQGEAQQLRARVGGSGDLDATAMRATNADLSSEGSGGVRARAEGGSVDVFIGSSGNVELWGDAAVRTVRVSGSGKLVRH